MGDEFDSGCATNRNNHTGLPSVDEQMRLLSLSKRLCMEHCAEMGSQFLKATRDAQHSLRLNKLGSKQ